MDKKAYFEDLINKNPSHPMPYYSLAQIYIAEKNYEKAAFYIEKYLELNKDDQGFGYKIAAECFINLNNKEKAKHYAELGIKASLSHNHPSMAKEIEDLLKEIEML